MAESNLIKIKWVFLLREIYHLTNTHSAVQTLHIIVMYETTTTLFTSLRGLIYCCDDFFERWRTEWTCQQKELSFSLQPFLPKESLEGGRKGNLSLFLLPNLILGDHIYRGQKGIMAKIHMWPYSTDGSWKQTSRSFIFYHFNILFAI